MTCTLRSADDQENHKDYLERTPLTLSRQPAPRRWGTLLGRLKASISAMSKAGSRFYLVNDRPVALVPTENGGTDCVAFDFATGELVPDRSYFGYLTPGSGRDVDVLTETAFEARLAVVRAEAGALAAAELRRWALRLSATGARVGDLSTALAPFARGGERTVSVDLPPRGYRRIRLGVDERREGWVKRTVELEPAGRLLTPEVLDAEFHAKRQLPIPPDSGLQGNVWYDDVTAPDGPAGCEVRAHFRDQAAVSVQLSVSHTR
jgi:hypothetical protein